MQALNVAKKVYDDIKKAIKQTENELEILGKEFTAGTGVTQIDRRLQLRERLKDLQQFEKDAKRELKESKENAEVVTAEFKEARKAYQALTKELDAELMRYADEISRYCSAWKEKALVAYKAMTGASSAVRKATGLPGSHGEDAPSAEVEYLVKRLWEHILFGA